MDYFKMTNMGLRGTTRGVSVAQGRSRKALQPVD